MMDLVIPTCQRDLAQVQFLLRSLDTFLDRAAVSSLCLISIDRPDFFAQVRKLSTHKFQSCTQYLTTRDLGLREADDDYRRRGWKLQQAAKLSFARFTRSEFFMVLDSKNFALRSIGTTDLIDENRATLMPEPVSFHAKWYRGSAWALAHSRFDCTPERSAISSATPVTFHSKSVVTMLDWLETHHGESIERFFAKRRLIRDRLMLPTEFTLYYVFMDREGLLDRHHRFSEYLHDKPSQMWASMSPAVLDERLRRILAGDTKGLFTAMHPGPWEALAEADRAALQALVSGASEPGIRTPS